MEKIVGKRICPKCHKMYSEYPAISRVDGKTKICSQCGMNEAMQDFANFCDGVLERMKKDFGLKGANS